MALLAGAAFGADSPQPGAAPPTIAAAGQTNDTEQAEYRNILEADDDAQSEIERWISETQSFKGTAAWDPRGSLNNRIRQRLEPVAKAYRDFILRHPDHVPIRLAYGSFLNDSGSEDGALAQWEKARDLAPGNPAPYNNLADVYAHRGAYGKAFDCLEKAIELKPSEAVYRHNLASHILVLRAEAAAHYKITEAQAFDKAQALCREAVKLAPANFVYAAEYAQSFYGAPAPKFNEALAAWEAALRLAGDKLEREGIYIHFARLKIRLGRQEEARKDLDAITDPRLDTLKQSLLQSLTNTVPAPAVPALKPQ